MPSDESPAAEPAAQPVAAQTVLEPQSRPPHQGSRSWWPLLLLLFLLVLGGAFLTFLVSMVGVLGSGAFASEGRVQEKHFSHVPGAADKVVIFSIEGAILSGEGFFKRQIDRLGDDDRVKAVVLRINSPGGMVSASDYMYHHLKKISEQKELPLIVSMGGIAASGGYYVAMAVGDRPDSIYAEPTTWTGSIGVIIPHYDLSKMLNDWGVEEDSIASHRLKGMGSLAKPMTEEERKIFQGLVDDAFARFKKIVQEGRPKFAKDPEALDKVATGQVFTADQAVANGLVDRIGFVEDAVDRAIEAAGLNPDNVDVVRYTPEPTLADVLLGAQSETPRLDLAALLEMTVPRAYYLCTRMPPVLTSAGR